MMRTFDIYNHPSRGYEAVKQGFSWPAFFLTGIWLLIKRLWGYAVGFFATIFVLGIFQGMFEHEESETGVLLIVLLQMAVGIFVSAKGNLWRGKGLEKRGYQHIRAIEAATPDAAISLVAIPASTTVSSQAQDFDQQLRRLAGLKEEGILSPEEFDQKKKLLLGLS